MVILWLQSSFKEEINILILLPIHLQEILMISPIDCQRSAEAWSIQNVVQISTTIQLKYNLILKNRPLVNN